MKIALIGDLQYKPGEEETLFTYMRQVASWRPDLAVSMGDMGSGKEAGTKKAMEQCRAFLDVLPCEKIVLLGNHDVEYRPDNDTVLRDQEKTYTEVFGLENAYRAVHIGPVLLLCLSVERQPIDLLLAQNALYTSDRQLAWMHEQLASHKGPVIILSHAPVAGSRLRCCPPVHHAATDAFMGQNFDPHLWRDLLTRYPNIMLWGSAHFHMGHNYERAITHTDGVTHFSCGVMASCSRDDTCQTRLMEVLPDGSVSLSTMHHRENGAVTPDITISTQIKLPDEKYDLLIGEDKALRVWDAPLLRRAYIATQKGRLWEYDRDLKELTGTVCQGEIAQEVCLFCGRIYVKTDSSCFSVPHDSLQRFLRLSGFNPRLSREETSLPAPSFVSIPFTTRSAPEGEYILF